MHKIGLISLGCAKNLVDSEMVLGMLDKSNFELVSDPHKAEVIIINTCGFIDASKKESINTIFEMCSLKKKKVVVIGCLVERYLDELKSSLPEVSLFVPIREYYKLNEYIESLFVDNTEVIEISPFNRVLTTPSYSAYLRISEGCDNRCTYCAIPLIRGGYRSRPLEDILKEADILKDKGIKELVIISQDVTRYGSDFTDNTTLVTLLKELVKKNFYSIRLLYLYPDEITEELIDYIIATPSIANYFDIPIQHSNTEVLKAMNRRGDNIYLTNLFKTIKTKAPDAILRTTLIVGFPGETKEQFNELVNFIKDVKFDHLGCFTYSREEGTASYSFDKQIRSDIKTKRHDEIMMNQQIISYEQNKKHIGEVMEGIVIGYDPKDQVYHLRSYWNAPDDIDGSIMFESNRELHDGDIVKVKITSAFVYDLFGEEFID